MESTMIRPRVATPERWQAALKRALAAGVTLLQISGTGEAVATSATKPGVVYRTDGTDCECEAAQLGGDPICVHRAAYWHMAGTLDLDGDTDPEPAPPAPSVARMWSQKDERLMQIAISTEVVARCVAKGQRWTDLSADELRKLRWAIFLDFTSGKTGAEARAKKAAMYRALDAGAVPSLARMTASAAVAA